MRILARSAKLKLFLKKPFFHGALEDGDFCFRSEGGKEREALEREVEQSFVTSVRRAARYRVTIVTSARRVSTFDPIAFNVVTSTVVTRVVHPKEPSESGVFSQIFFTVFTCWVATTAHSNGQIRSIGAAHSRREGSQQHVYRRRRGSGG